MPTNVATNYLNSKGRRIFKSAKGAFYSVGADGKKVYKPKAAFRKAGGEGAKVKITAKRNSTKLIPSPIRPAVAKKRSDAGKARGPQAPSYKKALVGRKVRSNKGVARGPREGTLQRRMNAAAARRRVAGTRKVRSNKGVARGPREGTLQRRMNAEAARRRAAGPRKVRVNRGVARGPREGTLQRRMNAEAARRRRVARKPRTGRLAAMRSTARKLTQLKTPTEAELYQMIFGTPPKRKVRANKGTKRGPRKTAAKKKSPLRMMLRSGRTKK